MPLGLSGDGEITGFDPTASGFGKVLQVVRATDTTDRSTTASSWTDTNLSVSITPSKSTSVVIVIATVFAAITRSGDGDNFSGLQITNASNVAISGANGDSALIGSNSTSTWRSSIFLLGYDAPATTSATTYKLRFQASSSDRTLTLRNATQPAQLLAIEVAA